VGPAGKYRAAEGNGDGGESAPLPERRETSPPGRALAMLKTVLRVGRTNEFPLGNEVSQLDAAEQVARNMLSNNIARNASP